MWQPQGIYSQYLLRTPVVLSGKEAARGLHNYPAVRIAVIHGSSFHDQDFFLNVFKKRSIRFIQRSWAGEPDRKGLLGTLSELEAYRPDTIIAVGGGSVIDGTKLCRVFYEFPFFEPGVNQLDGDLFKTNFIAIPTTIGSGAEVSSAAVYVDVEHHRKEMVVIHELQPDVVVYDEHYVRDTPQRLLCSSALDAMAHILEGYVSNVENRIAEMIAEEGMSALCEELEKLKRGKTVEIDFFRLQYAGYMGGIVQNHCIVGAAHAIAHQLTEEGFSHSEAVALLLPAVIRENARDVNAGEKYQRISKAGGFKSVSDMVDFIGSICQIGEIDTRRPELKKLLLSLESDDRFLTNVKKDRGGKGNPVSITDEYIKKVIRSI